MSKIQRFTPSMGLAQFAKRHYFDTTVSEALILPAERANKDINKRFVERFEAALRLRGESVNGALNALRASGFKMHRSTLQGWKCGRIPTFNSFQFTILAQYAGFPSFIEMLTDQPVTWPAPPSAGIEGK